MSQPPPRTGSLTLLLERAAAGDAQAAASAFPLVYDELRAMADARLRRMPSGQTLQATALVHEAYLRLVGDDLAASSWASRSHFFFAAARAMRDVMAERARRNLRRQGIAPRAFVDPDSITAVECAPPEAMLTLVDALTRLEREDARAHEVVLLRFFAGLGQEEIAAALGVSERTIERDWRFARAWLHKAIGSAEVGGGVDDSTARCRAPGGERDALARAAPRSDTTSAP